jgi:hypothetical protein
VERHHLHRRLAVEEMALSVVGSKNEVDASLAEFFRHDLRGLF